MHVMLAEGKLYWTFELFRKSPYDLFFVLTHKLGHQSESFRHKISEPEFDGCGQSPTNTKLVIELPDSQIFVEPELVLQRAYPPKLQLPVSDDHIYA